MILDGHSPDAIAQAARCLADGGLVGLPTETVYGLMADASRPAAVAGIVVIGALNLALGLPETTGLEIDGVAP